MGELVQSLLPALGAEFVSYLRGMVGGTGRLLASFLFQTADPTSPGRPFTQPEVIHRLLPPVQMFANAALAARGLVGRGGRRVRTAEPSPGGLLI